MDRVFLDANVLFSAAYREDSGLRRLWDLRDIVLMASYLAVEEARRNLEQAGRQERLKRLTGAMEIFSCMESEPLPDGVKLPENDRHILQAAIKGRATHLLSGDRKAYGCYYGRRVSGILILRPADYLAKRGESQAGRAANVPHRK